MTLTFFLQFQVRYFLKTGPIISRNLYIVVEKSEVMVLFHVVDIISRTSDFVGTGEANGHKSFS